MTRPLSRRGVNHANVHRLTISMSSCVNLAVSVGFSMHSLTVTSTLQSSQLSFLVSGVRRGDCFALFTRPMGKIRSLSTSLLMFLSDRDIAAI